MAGSIYIYSDRPDVAAEIAGWAKAEGKTAILLAAGSEEAETLKNAGADKILCLNGNGTFIGNYIQAVAELLQSQEADLLMAASTVRGREFAAGVAGALKCAMISDIRVAHFEDNVLKTEKMIYGGAVCQYENTAGFAVVTVPPAVFEKPSADGETGIETFEAAADARISLVSAEPIVKNSVDLTKAEKIVSVGLGVKNKEDLKLAYDLADAIGAEVGCSRSIADEYKWMDEYIGMTGVTVKPKLYLTIGISGQIQHVFGIRDSKIIVAIDKNENAPIFRAADYGIVGDLYEIVPALTEKIKNM